MLAAQAPAEIQFDPKGNFRIGIKGGEIVAVINGKAIKGKHCNICPMIRKPGGKMV